MEKNVSEWCHGRKHASPHVAMSSVLLGHPEILTAWQHAWRLWRRGTSVPRDKKKWRQTGIDGRNPRTIWGYIKTLMNLVYKVYWMVGYKHYKLQTAAVAGWILTILNTKFPNLQYCFCWSLSRVFTRKKHRFHNHRRQPERVEAFDSFNSQIPWRGLM